MPTRTVMARIIIRLPMAFLRAFAYFVDEAAHQPLAQPPRQRRLDRHDRGQPVRAGRVPHRGERARRAGHALDREGPGDRLPRGRHRGPRAREPREPAARATRRSASVELVTPRARRSRASASMFRDLSSLPEDLGENPFPASLEVTLRAERPVAGRGRAAGEGLRRARPACARSSTTCSGSSGSPRACGWCAAWARFLGGILVLAGVFTISNVIRLTIYAREDELDIMRLVGATQAYVKGPFVAEGVIQGGLGGLVAAGPAVGGARAGSRGASPPRTSSAARPSRCRRPRRCCSWPAAWPSASSAACISLAARLSMGRATAFERPGSPSERLDGEAASAPAWS